MLTITDINGNVEGLTGYRGLRRKRNKDGEKTLSFVVLPTLQNMHSYDMVAEESVVEFDGDSYRIKQLAEKSKGIVSYKEVVAVHTFYDLIDKHVYETNTGSMTFDTAVNFAIGGMGYTWDAVDMFYAQDFDNFGDDNRLSLFHTVLERYGAEFTLNGTHIIFRERIGNATDFQFRYNYNVKTISRDVNTNNLSTYIKGYGKKNDDGTYVVESEYTSPNAAVFGIRDAKPVRDERYTTLEGLNARLVADLNDEPEVSITLDFADLRRAGFPYDVPTPGDDVFLIYEPIGIDVEVRLIEIDEEFTEASPLPIRTTVTLGNIHGTLVDRYANTEKQVKGIIGDDGKVRYTAVDAAIQRATEALQSAETELEFNNGIIARDKTNPNNIVLLNSAGIGVSTDGGATFRTAMTGEGIVADLITVGTLSFNMLKGGTVRLGELTGDGDLKVWGDPNGDGVPDMVGSVDIDGAYFPAVSADHFEGDVENKWMIVSNIVYYFDADNGDDENEGATWATAKKNIQTFINTMPKNLNGCRITLYLKGTVYGGINASSFRNGTLIIAGKNDERPKVFGRVILDFCVGGRFLVQDIDGNGDQSTGGHPLFSAFNSGYVIFFGCKAYGNSLASHGFWVANTKFSVTECHVYDIGDRGLYVTEGSQGVLINGRGNPSIALVADDGSIVSGHGCRWAGSIVRWSLSQIGTYIEDRGDWVIDPWNTYPIGSGIDYGEAAPPPPPPSQEQTITIVPSTGDNYSSQGFWTNDEVKQGDYGYGARYGLWYADLSAVKGKTIVQATITLSRGSGGTYAARTIYFRTHNYTHRGARPGGAPAMSGVGATGSLAVGQSGTFDITAMVQNHIASGVDSAIGVHTTGSTDYMSLSTRPTITIRYK